MTTVLSGLRPMETLACGHDSSGRGGALCSHHFEMTVRQSHSEGGVFEWEESRAGQEKKHNTSSNEQKNDEIGKF